MVDVVVDQGLLVEDGRCPEGTEEVTSPDDVGHYVDDEYHSFDGNMRVHPVLDAPLSLDEGLLLDVYLDDLFGLDDPQPLVLDDFLDVFADDVYVVGVDMV